MPLEELEKFKFRTGEDPMSNKEYLGLRYVVECTLNIEYYCNNPKTKTLLDKLFKHKDNQLKLFVLESYIKKKKNIKKLNLNTIARDLRSRYLLYNLLTFYNKQDLMPKKYRDEKEICESELYSAFANDFGFEREPKSIKFYKKIEKDNKDYYLFKFKAKKAYNEIVKDYATDYLVKNNHFDKYLTDIDETYIGIAGGRDLNDPLLVNPDIVKYYEVFDKNKDIDDYINDFFKKEEVIIPSEEKPTEEQVIIPSKFKKVVNMNTFYVFQLIIIVLLAVILILYINDINLFNIKKGKFKIEYITYKKTEITKVKDFNEINGNDIYNVDDGVYYVLVFKKKDSSEYYTFVKTLLENGYRVFYVDLSKEENFFLKDPNQYGMSFNKDKFIKVNNRDFEYYVDGKEFILSELKSETNEVIKNNTLKKIEEESNKALEEEQNKENVENTEN